jgi:ribosomal protein S18 acetylase RimI-like enzyme
MYAEYVRERLGHECVETDQGFATFALLNDNKSCYILDIYVRPDFRRLGAASTIADKIVAQAKSRGATELFGTVVLSAAGSDASLRVLQGYGMSLHEATNGVIVMRKEI